MSPWQRLPIILRAILTGIAVLFAGTVPWSGIAGHAFFAGWNLRIFSSVPWAILPTSAYLWLYWRYLDGSGWPSSTAQARRMNLRANPLSAEVWGMSLFAGTIGLATLFPLLRIMNRLAILPAEAEPITMPPQMPFVTVFLLLVMSSVVAGIVEEAAFRGYMQGPIERRYGPAVAIIVNGTVFGLAHYNHHPASVLVMLPFYLAVTAVYGGLAYATNSILPGMVLHAAGDVFSLTRLWTSGQSEWQVSAATPTLVWETGVDFSFLRSATVFVLFGATAVWAYFALARTARMAPSLQVRR